MAKPGFIEFTTEDGLTLPGLLYEAKDSKKAVVYLHGNGSSSVFYSEGENRDLPDGLTKKGFSLLKFNNRGAHIIKKFNIGEERMSYGMAYELIKECVPDIDGAIQFLKGLGYGEFYLAGASTGANKICVYDHYRPQNPFKKYILICGGDDSGIYRDMLGEKLFLKILEDAKGKISKGQGDGLIPDLLPFDLVFSYKGFNDIVGPDGDYNSFPFSEAFGISKLSKKPLFGYFSGIKKPSLVVYGENDEHTWGDIGRVIKTLKKYQPGFDYEIIKGADHRFTGKKRELARVISSWLT